MDIKQKLNAINELLIDVNVNNIINVALENKYENIIRIMMAHHYHDVSGRSYKNLLYACEHGIYTYVKCYFESTQLYENDDDNYGNYTKNYVKAFNIACEKGDYNIIMLILFYINDDYLFNNNDKVAELLLKK